MSFSPTEKSVSLPTTTTTTTTATGSESKKSQPIPWSHQETIALIQSYQQKWYSLNKGQLKAFQWEEVVSNVAKLCGLQQPSKTSTQCRHKIEKLRKRYRQEAIKPYPHSWQFFQLMDQMERGPNATPFIPYNNSNSNSNNRCVVESNESDEEWRVGLDGSRSSNKSKSVNINNNAKAMNGRFVGVLRDRRSGKRKNFYGGGYSSEEVEEEEEDYNDVVAGENVVEEEEGGNVGRELAAEIRGFAESFVRMESGKIEMMREKERRMMEMEKKRMEMIIGGQRKIVETIGRAFGTDKRQRMD